MARVFTDAGAMKLISAVQRMTNLDSFSVGFWLFRTATPAANRNIISACDITNPAGWIIRLLTTNLIQAVFPYTTTDKQRSSATAPALNTWVHVLVTHNNTGLNSTDFVFYFDGKSEAGTSVANGVGTHDSATACAIEVGASAADATTAPPANIGPFAIWSRALSPAEALALAAGAHPLRMKEGLVELFDLDTAAYEEGWISKLFLAQGATNPASSAVRPRMEAPPVGVLESRLNVRPIVRSRARYFAAGFVNTPVALAVSSAFTAALSRQALFPRALAVASTFTPSLVRVAKYVRTLAVSSTFTPALNRGYARTLAATSSMTAALAKARSIALAVSSTFGPGIARGALYLRTLVVASTFGVALSRVAARARALAVSTVTTVSLVVGRAYARTLAASSTLAASITRRLTYAKTLAASSAFTVAVAKRQALGISLSANSAFVASVSRSLVKRIQLSVASVFGALLNKIVAIFGTNITTFTGEVSIAPRFSGLTLVTTQFDGETASAPRFSGDAQVAQRFTGVYDITPYLDGEIEVRPAA